VNRLARMAVLNLALLCAFTIGAGVAVRQLLPPRLALFQLPHVSGRGLAAAGQSLPGAGTPGVTATGYATPSGVSARLSALIGSLGPHYGAMVANLSTGRVLYQVNSGGGFAPASTTKIATAVAAISVLGPAARFTTSVVLPASAASAGAGAGPRAPVIVLVGGGDPVLAVHAYPAADYPQPATLAALAAQTARQLRARSIGSVRLRYDGALFSGPPQAQGWPALGTADNYVTTGNMTIITGLEVDQGRLNANGTPEDADDPTNFRPRSVTPSLDAAAAFASLLRKHGISVHGIPAADSSGSGTLLAAVHSPPLAQIVQQMLSESNNVIAETLARHVALATGRPATFAGAGAAVMAVDRGLKVSGVHLVDGSGLSPDDRIAPAALVSLVRLAAGAGPAKLRPVITGLPVAGFSGTLAAGSPFGPFGATALGTVRAKTGNISGVATMAGLAYTASGQVLAFAFMGNNIPPRLQLQAESTLAQLATALSGCGCG
jgi:D-alanyl-D-alanine carboxypeptidase/D-alanyl-D-alanine-endopeptidase (penicillin-binding protein 4)